MSKKSSYDFRSRTQKQAWLESIGFLPSEAQQFSRTSVRGYKVPYWRRMLNSRRTLYNNALRYGWTNKQYQDYIRDIYINRIDNGIKDGKIFPWALLKHYEGQGINRGDEYESPWRSKTKKRRKGTKRNNQRVTRKSMLESKINSLRNKVQKTANINKRLMLEDELAGYEQQYRNLGRS